MNPKYHENQVLRNLHSWAINHPPRPVIDVAWDKEWKCYTYWFPLSLIRIEEKMLQPTGEPDITADDWIIYRDMARGIILPNGG